MLPIRIPILTYHALHAPGWEYWENDHVALEEDLKLIKKHGFKVVSLVEIYEFIMNKKSWPDYPVIGISFDDATDHDFKATSFVIASPDARQELDKTCIAGRKQWNDSWWLSAAESGILDIANHSWDHTHSSLTQVVNANQIKGRFDHIDNQIDADLQIMQAEIFIAEKIKGFRNGLFAYPYGHYNDFLVDSYFPNNELFNAAFITSGNYVTPDTNPWKIPRFVCGEDWNRPEGLVKILKGI